MALLEKRQKDAQAIGGTNKKGGRSQRGAKDGAKIGPKRCSQTPKNYTIIYNINGQETLVECLLDWFEEHSILCSSISPVCCTLLLRIWSLCHILGMTSLPSNKIEGRNTIRDKSIREYQIGMGNSTFHFIISAKRMPSLSGCSKSKCIGIG
jgi:hypothetical protein